MTSVSKLLASLQVTLYSLRVFAAAVVAVTAEAVPATAAPPPKAVAPKPADDDDDDDDVPMAEIIKRKQAEAASKALPKPTAPLIDRPSAAAAPSSVAKVAASSTSDSNKASKKDKKDKVKHLSDGCDTLHSELPKGA